MPRNVKMIKMIGKLLSIQMIYLQVNIKKLLTVSDIRKLIEILKLYLINSTYSMDHMTIV